MGFGLRSLCYGCRLRPVRDEDPEIVDDPEAKQAGNTSLVNLASFVRRGIALGDGLILYLPGLDQVCPAKVQEYLLLNKLAALVRGILMIC